MDWSSAECVSTNYQQRLVLESWYTNSEKVPLNRCQSYLHLTNDSYMITNETVFVLALVLASSRSTRMFSCAYAYVCIVCENQP